MPEEQKNLEITANYIGPIISLKSENGGLSNKGERERNLIFAKNGMGKSFLSRAFRYLDIYQHQQDASINEAAHYLVSKESEDNESAPNKGEFKIKSGSNVIGELQLTKGFTKDTGIAKAEIGDRIFHVFCGEFVQEELRKKDYKPEAPDPNKQIEILVGGDNIKLENKKGELEQKKEEQKQIYNGIFSTFYSDKKELQKQANISGNLAEFKALNFEDSFLQKYKEKPLPPDKKSDALQQELKNLKSIPASAQLPTAIEKPHAPYLLIGDVSESLKEETSPTIIADDIKQKIEKHPHFFETGLDIHEHDPDICPFCGQGTTSGMPAEIIETYIKYFKNAEADHKKRLKDHEDALQKIKEKIAQVKADTNQEKIHYDNIKKYIPSLFETEIESVNVYADAIINDIEEVEKKIAEKRSDLTQQISADEECVSVHTSYGNLLEKMLMNEDKFAYLKEKYENLEEERKSIQRRMCEAFEVEFVIKNHAKIAEWHVAVEATQKIESDIDDLEIKDKQRKAFARDRVAETFQELLRFFFKNKYTFCEDTFVIKLGGGDLPREADRTLSDGEKTIIAFCWFVASIHLKVKSNSDYAKIFLVFDDPITSLSYDYIFSMADILKSLSILSTGKIDISPERTGERPSILILTHSDSFFNICLSNKVIPERACFALEVNNDEYKLNRFLEKHVIPFRQQLRHIYMVKEQRECPEFYTANSIRSVLEFFFRICRPDDADRLDTIASAIKSSYGIDISCTLLHSSSHPGDTECNPSDEIIRACEDTIAVINRLAPGQITSIKKMVANEEVS